MFLYTQKKNKLKITLVKIVKIVLQPTTCWIVVIHFCHYIKFNYLYF